MFSSKAGSAVAHCASIPVRSSSLAEESGRYPRTYRPAMLAPIALLAPGRLALSKRSETPFPTRPRGISLPKGVGSQLACSKPVSPGLLQEEPRSPDRGSSLSAEGGDGTPEWLRTAALAKRTRDASSTRARLSLSAQGLRGVGQGGRSRRVSESSPPGRPDTPAGRRDGPKVSPGLSAGGCRVKTGSGPLERSLPPGSGALGRGGTGANVNPRVMSMDRAARVRACRASNPVRSNPNERLMNATKAPRRRLHCLIARTTLGSV